MDGWVTLEQGEYAEPATVATITTAKNSSDNNDNKQSAPSPFVGKKKDNNNSCATARIFWSAQGNPVAPNCGCTVGGE